MNFAQTIIKARRRIFDYRDASGSIIVDATKDGIRWSSSDLVDSATEALVELTRDLMSYNFKNYINTSMFSASIPAKITVEGKVDFPVSGQAFGSYMVNQVERIIDDNNEVYDYIPTKEFYSKIKRANTLGDKEYLFTQHGINNSGDPDIYVTPNPANELDCRVICTISSKKFFKLSNTGELPFVDIDDIMLDYIERNCKLKEHDIAQVASLDKVIEVKFAKLKLREQNGNV